MPVKSLYLLLPASHSQLMLAAVVALALALPARLAHAQIPVTFDFDSGTPTLPVFRNVPFDQTAGGITAHFSSPQGRAFSVQTDVTTGYSLSMFSGKYLDDNLPVGTYGVLGVDFSQQLTNITLTFATADIHAVETTSFLQLSAFDISTPVGAPVSNQAPYGANSLPMGTLTFSSAIPFNRIEITIPPGQPTGGVSDFLVDNLIVLSTGVNLYTIATSASPGAGGATSGGGTFTNAATVTVAATPNAGYAFVDWTEGGTPASTTASYTFTATANRTLAANFTVIPHLQISLTTTNTIVVSWAATSIGFTLQENLALNPASWADTTNKVIVTGGQSQVVETPWAGTRFFRLYHP
jgi:hypothetical protein